MTHTHSVTHTFSGFHYFRKPELLNNEIIGSIQRQSTENIQRLKTYKESYLTTLLRVVEFTEPNISGF